MPINNDKEGSIEYIHALKGSYRKENLNNKQH